MSRYNNIVPIPLGEIRCLDGALPESEVYPGTLVTAIAEMAGGSSLHAQSAQPNATFALNAVGITAGMLIVMEQEEMDVTVANPAAEPFAASEAGGPQVHARAHVLKAGEEVTVIMAAAATIVSGTILYAAADGKVATAVNGLAMFSAIETCADDSENDDLRILARVL